MFNSHLLTLLNTISAPPCEHSYGSGKNGKNCKRCYPEPCHLECVGDEKYSRKNEKGKDENSDVLDELHSNHSPLALAAHLAALPSLQKHESGIS